MLQNKRATLAVALTLLLRLYRIPCIEPGGEPAEQGIYFFVAVIQEQERRTGTRVFVLSGAVGDNPLVFFERETFDVGLEIAERNGYGSRGMTIGVGICAAYVDEDGGAGFHCGFGVADGDARNLGFRQRGLVALGLLTRLRLSRKRNFCRDDKWFGGW